MNTNGLKIVSSLLVLINCVDISFSLLCYNCSATHLNRDQCGGEFANSVAFNDSRQYLLNCTEDNAMCFVRSWAARANHAWIVQRGCYHVNAVDPFPKAMDTPTRAMTCKYERLADAEYKVCLCRADWCNTGFALSESLNSKRTARNFLYIFSMFLIKEIAWEMEDFSRNLLA